LAFLLCLFASALGPLRASAALISIVGPPGAAGTLGGPGEDGGPGDTATATTLDALLVTQRTTLSVTGGTGGAGGAGGPPGGNGGAGGEGGAAAGTLTATDPNATVPDFDGNPYSPTLVLYLSGGAGGTGGTGAAGGIGGAGGAATGVTAFGSPSLSLSGRMSSAVSGGRGGNGGAPGGDGGAGGDASVDSSLEATSGTNTIRATGGAGGSGSGVGSTGGAGGDAQAHATSDLLVTGNRSLDLSVSATAGTGGSGATGGAGGDARAGVIGTVTGTSTAMGHLRIYAEAIGGDSLGHGGQAGNASLDVVRGDGVESDVDVSGLVRGGSGDRGVSVDLENAVDGSTTYGSLFLSQSANGGDGILSGGNARSVMTRENTSPLDTFLVEAGATGGGLLNRGVPPDASGTGYAEARVRSHSAEVQYLGVRAIGKGGGDLTSTGADGADGTAIAFGDADEGVRRYMNVEASARGGDGGAVPVGGTGPGGNGGNAFAEGDGTYLGDGTLYNIVSATAGAGGAAPGGGLAGTSGDSRAVARSYAPHAVTSWANAGSWAGTGSGLSLTGPFGTALAEAHAVGAHETQAALQLGGAHFEGVGDALLTSAEPLARVGVHMQGEQNAVTGNPSPGGMAEAVLHGSYDTENAAQDFTNQNHGNAVLAFGAPKESSTAEWLAGNSQVQSAFGPGSRVFAIGYVAASSTVTEFFGDMDFEFASELLAPGEQLHLGFLDVSSTGLGFDALDIQIEVDHALVADLHFDDVASALAALDDEILPVALAHRAGSAFFDVSISYQFSLSGKGNAFTTDFTLFSAVPEPELELLVIVALALLAALRIRSGRVTPTFLMWAMLGSAAIVRAGPLEQLDQHFIPVGGSGLVAVNSGGDANPLNNISAFAQTFTVGSAGFLTGVEVTYDDLQQSLTVGILRVDAAGFPLGPPDFSTALAAVTIGDLQSFPKVPFVRVTFGPTEIPVSPGDSLALVMTGVRWNGSTYAQGESESIGDGYPGGAFYDWALSSTGPYWRNFYADTRGGAGVDLAFKTFTTPVPEPSVDAMLIVGLALLTLTPPRRH
jgi:hypothetical protein